MPCRHCCSAFLLCFQSVGASGEEQKRREGKEILGGNAELLGGIPADATLEQSRSWRAVLYQKVHSPVVAPLKQTKPKAAWGRKLCVEQAGR